MQAPSGNIEQELDTLQAGNGGGATLPLEVCSLTEFIDMFSCETNFIIPYNSDTLVANGVFTASSSGVWVLEGSLTIGCRPLALSDNIGLEVGLITPAVDLLSGSIASEGVAFCSTTMTNNGITELEFFYALVTVPIFFIVELNENDTLRLAAKAGLGGVTPGEGNSVIVYGSQSSKLIWKKVA